MAFLLSCLVQGLGPSPTPIQGSSSFKWDRPCLLFLLYGFGIINIAWKRLKAVTRRTPLDFSAYLVAEVHFGRHRIGKSKRGAFGWRRLGDQPHVDLQLSGSSWTVPGHRERDGSAAGPWEAFQSLERAVHGTGPGCGHSERSSQIQRGSG